MAKKILVIMLITIMLVTTGMIGMPMKTKAAVPHTPIPVSPVSDFTICPPSVSNTINFNCTSVSGATSYRFQVATDVYFSSTSTVYDLVTPYNHSYFKLDAGIDYFWRVLANNLDGDSPWSTTATFRILLQAPELIAPLGLTSSGDTLFIWRTCFYSPTEIQIAASPDFSSLLFDATFYSNQAIAVSGGKLEYSFNYPYLMPAGHYWWRAKVMLGTTESSWTTGYFRVILPPQTVPMLISPSDGALIKQLNKHIVWTPVPEASKYELSINNHFIVVNTNTYYLYGSDNSIYQIRIRAGNVAGWGPWSGCYTFRILLPPGTPSLITPQNRAVIQNTNSVLLRCSSIETAEYYRFQITDLTLGTSQSFRVTAPYTTLNYVGIWSHQYSWWVKAYNLSGESNSSNTYYFAISENIPPRIEIDSYPQYTNQSNIVISGKAYDLESGIAALCYRQQNISLSADGTFQITFNLKGGPNSFTLIAIDRAGNKIQRSIGIVKDITPPIVTVTQPMLNFKDEATVVTDIKVEGQIKDNLPVRLWIDNTEVTVSSSGRFSYPVMLHFWANTINLKAVDAAGNTTIRSLLISKISPVAKCVFQIHNPIMEVYRVNEKGKIQAYSQEIDPGRGTVPVIVSNRTFIPVRALVESIGGKVVWIASQRKVVIVLPYRGMSIDLKIGNNMAKITDSYGNVSWAEIEKGDSKVVPFIKNDRSYFPLRFVVETLGFKVNWDSVLEIITIEFPLTPPQP